MNITTKERKTLEMDCFYKKEEILEMGMKPLNNHQMNYLVFERDAKVYFFEYASKESLRLFCITGKNSFYLS